MRLGTEWVHFCDIHNADARLIVISGLSCIFCKLVCLLASMTQLYYWTLSILMEIVMSTGVHSGV